MTKATAADIDAWAARREQERLRERAGPPRQQTSTSASQDLLPLVFVDPACWQGLPVPQRRWLIRNRIPANNVTLLYGDGAAGKTTITIQLLLAVLTGTSWLGAVVDEPGRSMFFSGEESNEEIHYRLAAVLEHQGAQFTDLAEHVQVLGMPGEDCILASASKGGTVQPTALYHRLKKSVDDFRPALLAIEAAADVLAINENDRAQVRQGIGLLRALTLNDGPAVLLLAHPSLTGLNTGTGTSGSTGWRNSVRSQLYFATPRAQESDEPDVDLRELRVMKSNYGPAGEIVKVRWQQSVYVLDGGQSSLQRRATEAAVDETYERLFDMIAAQERTVSPNHGKSYAPAIFETLPGANGFNRRAFAKAQERLLAAGRLAVKTVGPPSKQREIIIRPGHDQ